MKCQDCNKVISQEDGYCHGCFQRQLATQPKTEEEKCNCHYSPEFGHFDKCPALRYGTSWQVTEREAWKEFLNANDLYGSLYTEKFFDYWLSRFELTRKEVYEKTTAVATEITYNAAYSQCLDKVGEMLKGLETKTDYVSSKGEKFIKRSDALTSLAKLKEKPL